MHALRIVAAVAVLCPACAPTDPEVVSRGFGVGPAKTSPRINVDQFGYRPGDAKVAVITDPQLGFNAGQSFTPGDAYEVRRWTDDQVVFSGKPAAWNSGKVEASSGDRGWWFDFSSVSAPGSYYLFDSKNGVGSYRFEIADDVYRKVLIAATRMFFYNRCGAEKKPPYTDAKWQDAPAFIGPGQDKEARSVSDKTNAATAFDLSGGWFDAGDTNKYVTFTEQPLHQLLTAYEENVAIWTDDFGIPESGNGVPDLLDEVKWEVDWIRRMQRDDGGVLIKVGTIDDSSVSPPSQDKRPRYYAPKCSSSSIVAAGVFAHASLVFAKLPPLATDAADYKQRAIKAWTWYEASSKSDSCDSQEIKAGDADRSLSEQEQARVVAAIYLFALTGDAAYQTAIKGNYTKLRPYQDIGWSRYDAQQGEALLYYTKLASADSQLKQDILARKRQDATTASEIYAAALEQDLYRAYITDSTYHWGSNQPRANNGNSNNDVVTFAVDPGKEPGYRERALGILHYFHGVNPLGMVYLTNMSALGAEVSANEIFHTWFSDGTDWDNAQTSPKGPAPGYVPGGPNASYSGPTSPPKGQPAQKAYKDWNTGWPENSWEVTEPGIYYQASYVKLLSKFVAAPAAPAGDAGAPPVGDGQRTGDGSSPRGDGGRPGEGCGCAAAPSADLDSGVLLLAALVTVRACRRRRSCCQKRAA